MKLDLYLSGTLFSQDAETEALMNGDLDLCYTSSQWIAEYVDEANMFTAMYLYNNVDHLNAVLNGEIGAELFDTVAEKIGVYPLAAYYYGARDCLMVDGSKQYNTPEDMASQCVSPTPRHGCSSAKLWAHILFLWHSAKCTPLCRPI